MDEIEIHIEVRINPTEDPKKVNKAVESVFGPMKSRMKPIQQGQLLIAENKGIDGLRSLFNLLHSDRIRDAARGILYRGISNKSIIFYLNKQVAYVGHLSFSKPAGESPLGPIRVQINCDNPHELIEWLAPKTTRLF